MNAWTDYGLAGVGETETPLDWQVYGLKGFGSYVGHLGYIDSGLGTLAEVDDEGGYARTPMLELAPKDYNYIANVGFPYDGMLGLGDTGQVYQYDGNLGFFKKLFRRAKKRVKKGIRKARKLARKLVKKIPGVGKYLVRLGDKILKVSMKLIKPLTKFVGKYAAKLAPIAALIPGWGPAISAALYTGGKIANLMNKYGVNLIGKGKKKTLRFTSKKQAKAFKKALKKAARKEKRKRRRGMAGPGDPRVIRARTSRHEATLRAYGARRPRRRAA